MANRRPLIASVILVACSKAEPPSPKPELAPRVSVRFGDCAGADINWISGPAPTTFTDDKPPKLGRVPLAPYDTLPVPIEHTRWQGAVPQIAVPRAAGSSTDSEMPAGDDLAMQALEFRPKGLYLRLGDMMQAPPRLPAFLVDRTTQLARCFEDTGKVGFAQTVKLRITGGKTVVIEGAAAGTTACVTKLLRRFAFDEGDDVVASFELRRDPPPGPLPPPSPHLFDPARPRGTDPIYKPSHGNPLVAHAAAITKCAVASGRPYGVAVVQLGATRAVHGVDATTAACITEATRSLTGEKRCSLAFGTMPIGDLPAIDVTATPSTVDIAARHARFLGPSPPVVAIYGENVIRAKDDVAMTHVFREMSRVLMAHEDFLLARSTAAGWELFDPPSEPLPVIPVPHGTGGFWNRVPSPGHPGVDCDCVYVSFVSTRTSVWISLSRTNDHIEVPRDAKFATALAAELAKLKHTPYWEDRTDFEVAASDDSTYGQFLDLVVAARAAGWTDWRLRSLQTLHARPDLP
jgi:hypothetical protein